MKPIRLISTVAIAAFLGTSCQKKSAEVSHKVAELEKKANEAVTRQQELERQLEEQKLASERDALERERMKIEEERADIERQRENSTEEQAVLLRKREQELAIREGKVDQQRTELEEQESNLNTRDRNLSDKERELAGRGAIEFEVNDDSSAPVGDYGSFYDSLSPYGNWFETEDYGYVWQPLIVTDSTWRPYTRGHWACTDRGWFWISEEPFGWACYHYGRWALCQGYGWVWVPGTEWAPSWVCWRSGGSYVGWAPLPPETLAYRNHRWDNTVETVCGIGALWFNFVNVHDFGNPIQYHCLPYTQNTIYIDQTVNCTNINFYNSRVICGGPFYGDIQRQTKRKPPFYRIEEDRGMRPGRDPMTMRPRANGDRLRVANPNLDAAWNDSLMPEKVKRRIDTLKIARTEEIKPEISDRFRKQREENQRRADQAVAELGGADDFFRKRNQTLESNRTRIEEPRGRVPENPNTGRPIQLGGVSKERARELLDSGIRMGRPPVAPPGQAKLRTPKAEESTATTRTPNPGREDTPRVTPPDPRTARNQEETVPNNNNRQEQTRTNPQIRQGNPNPAQENPQRADGPRVTPPRGMERPQQDDTASNNRRQQEDQAERARQQQQEAQRQREQARQQQQEENRREQARQQQQEENRRQQQMEESRREQARQQQEESRREQARQQQQEESRRQQQQEESRRQQQQEESRREQARQDQQRQEQQRQEQQRQEQQRQDDDRRQRNR